jgi:AcrR family transcriptional regulator
MLTNHSINQPAIARREQAAWRRQQLLDAALRVFARAGIDGASMKEVAAAGGVAPGLLYHYFGSKDDLVIAVLERHGFLTELRELLEGAGDTPAAEILETLVARFATYIADQPDRVTLFFAGYANPHVRTALKTAVTQAQHVLSEFLTARVVTGELRSHDSGMTAQMLLSTVLLSQLSGLAIPPPILVNQVLLGIAATAAAPSVPTREETP